MTSAERALAELVSALNAIDTCALCIQSHIAHDECHADRLETARARAAKVLRDARPEAQPN